jgi:hypothetical protein
MIKLILFVMSGMGVFLFALMPLVENNRDTQSNIANSAKRYDFQHEPTKTVTNFLKWYKKNFDEISAIPMIDNYSIEYDSTKFYRVNFKGTEAYLSKLKSSGYISERYIKKWRIYFKEHDENFKKNPQNDGPPDGFEFDFVLWTQEIEGTLEAIDQLKVNETNETDNVAFIEIDISMRLGFYLTKYNGKWMIDAIENIGY